MANRETRGLVFSFDVHHVRVIGDSGQLYHIPRTAYYTKVGMSAPGYRARCRVVESDASILAAIEIDEKSWDNELDLRVL